MEHGPDRADDLLGRAKAGDERALGELFSQYRDRLERMVRLRLDRRLYGRLDPADVLQDAYLDLARRFGEYASCPATPFFLWLRGLVGQRLVDLHRRHLGAQMRGVGNEVSLHRGGFPQASSESLAHQLLGRLTSPTRALARRDAGPPPGGPQRDGAAGPRGGRLAALRGPE